VVASAHRVAVAASSMADTRGPALREAIKEFCVTPAVEVPA
jgi:hypothetical protein